MVRALKSAKTVVSVKWVVALLTYNLETPRKKEKTLFISYVLYIYIYDVISYKRPWKAWSFPKKLRQN